MERQEVVITDIRIPFSTMVSFMVSWTLASIPALVILAVIFSGIALAFSAVCALPFLAS